MEPEVMTPDEVATLLRLDRETVYRNLRRGRLPGYKVGNQWRISRDALKQSLDNQLHEQSPQPAQLQDRSA